LLALSFIILIMYFRGSHKSLISQPETNHMLKMRRADIQCVYYSMDHTLANSG
jgi:hypothetical protein